MKKAIGYVRISDKDQSNFSITGQADIIRSYCSKNDMEVISLFTDEGESAKNFDRPDWKQLEQFVKANHAQVDMLLVAKFDRFSRNVAEALQMIERLENKYSIRVMSAMEPISMHPSSPYYFQIRSQILLSGNVELLIIRDRTKFGMHHALKSGRYVSKAPIGYLNSRDAGNKPLLMINENKAPHIRQIFERFIAGDTVHTIRNIIKEKGLIITSHSGIQNILTNPVYMGFVQMPAYYDEPAALIKGIHQGIIEEDIWWKAHAIIHQGKRSRTTLSEDFPLRGVLKCYCSRQLTAANSRGRKMYVGYYKCNGHTGANFNAKKLHAQFNEILKEMSLPQFHIEYLQQKVMDNINQAMKDAGSQKQEKQQQLSELEKKINSIEEKYITDNIDKATFTKWKMKYHTEKGDLQDQLAALGRPGNEMWKQHSANLGRLTDLHWLYQAGTIEQKQSFVRLVFDSRLYYQQNIYRTPWILPIFATKAQELKEKGLLIIEQPEENNGENGESAPHRILIEPLGAFLQLLAQIKAA